MKLVLAAHRLPAWVFGVWVYGLRVVCCRVEGYPFVHHGLGRS